MKFNWIKKNYIYASFLVIVLFGILLSRRASQLLSPQVWVEDGTHIIPGFLTNGLVSFLEPLNGYIVLVPKLISVTSLWISAFNYPLVSTILTWIFIVLVGLAIALSPTKLKGRWLCAIAVFIIPTSPEVFGLPSYSFWWASLLLFLLALWDERHSSLVLRLTFLILGGLSSPIIVMVLPILYFRAYLYRRSRAELIIAVVATVIAAIQLSIILITNAAQMYNSYQYLYQGIPLFFGGYLVGNLTTNPNILWAAALGFILIILAWSYRNRFNLTTWILLFLLLGSLALTVARVNLAALDQILAGPRFFFYPFIMMSWILIQCFFDTPKVWFRACLGMLGIITLWNAIPAWSIKHDDLQWKAHLTSCTLFDKYAIPVHFSGSKHDIWYFQLPATTCAAMLPSKEADDLLSFAFTLQLKEYHHSTGIELVSTTMMSKDYPPSELEGYRVIGSHTFDNTPMGEEVILKLHRGDSFLYRAGPEKGGQSITIVGLEQEFIYELPQYNFWVTLDFSNASLPDEFIIKIKDEGSSAGQWSAVAFR